MLANLNVTALNPKQTRRRATDKAFKIVVAGEFNAGKSSVVNLLLRQDILPATVGFSDMPPIKVVASNREHYQLIGDDDNLIDVVEYREGKIKGSTIQSAEIELPIKQFDGAVITEISVDQHGELQPEAEAALYDADLLIWCTMGQRAWCLTEITVVKKLPQSVLDKSILAVTRADYLSSDANRQKVRTRLENEAGIYFDQVVMLNAGQKSIGDAMDDNTWTQNGGRALYDSVMNEFRKSEYCNASDAPAELLDLAAFRVTAPQEPSTPKAMNVGEVLAIWQTKISELSTWIAEQPKLSEQVAIARMQDDLELFLNMVQPAGTCSDPDLPEKIMRFNDFSSELSSDADVGSTANKALNMLNLMLQLEEELGAVA